ncbi:uncharacterized protein PV06_00527 [Exophiala oligosperma]|uniref:Enoyl reductase (ER) domain-containing protein n=1 Tax=Exophiala oligosperma TaxID=215243 RepID=A0A0D2B6J2_9EURO|nr:uncharacterized protein PV06_00527 [Exophiala oligosperma]KIW47871.1 hypothetical protein PV06_00527 [Exophiala oligosperma]
MAGIPSTMKAWTVEIGQHEAKWCEVPVPKPAPDAVLVKILAMGVCHSDCSILSLPDLPVPSWKRSFIMGHEASGEVVQLGSAVSKHQIGDIVTLMCCPGCQVSDCPECTRGLQRICTTAETYGLGRDGFFTEYAAVKEWAAVPVPKGVSPSAAAIAADAVLTSYHAVKGLAKVQPHETILMYGLGGVGLNGLQAMMHLGPKRVIVVEKRQELLDEAIKLGVPAKDAFCPSEETKVEDYLSAQKIVVDTAVDFVGADSTFASAQMSVRSGGTVVLVGMNSFSLPVNTFIAMSKELKILCSWNGTHTELREALDLMAKGVIRPQITTDNIRTMPRVLEDLNQGKIKGRRVLLH